MEQRQCYLEASSDFDIHRFSGGGNYIDRRRDDYHCRTRCVGRPITGTRIGRGYLEGDPSFTRTYKVPLIGIEVSNRRSELKSGVRLAGIEIYQVLPDSLRAAAGLPCRRAAVQVALVVVYSGREP
jgi:hypothetical protein